jgi:hypothetical protein
MITRYFVAALCSGVATAFLLVPEVASATWYSAPAGTCVPMSNGVGQNIGQPPPEVRSDALGAYVNDNPNGWGFDLMCPVIVTPPNLGNPNLSGAMVFGQANTNTNATFFRACRTFGTGGGGTCGGITNVNGNGNYAQRLADISAWRENPIPAISDGFYLEVYLTAPDPSGNDNAFFSYVISQN